MRLENRHWTSESGWSELRSAAQPGKYDLVLLFGGAEVLRDEGKLKVLRALYPSAHFLGCSTAGEIVQTNVFDDSLVATAIAFDKTRLAAACAPCPAAENSFEVGRRLANELPQQGLRHVLVLSAGLNVNGSELVKGLTSSLPSGVSVTGGLAGDGGRFKETWVISGDKAGANLVAVVGLYGEALRVAHGSLGGWDPFGPERLITASKGNVLFELDGRSALDLYKMYLGDQAKELPGSGLLFPLALRIPGEEGGLVRTILSIDEWTGSMTFAGDVPEGAYARLMKANFDRLVEGAMGAAESCRKISDGAGSELALLISCVGRKMVLKQRVEEEVEAVRDVIGRETCLVGFYSYGEISPFAPTARCELHNQTMTITTLSER